MSIANNKKTTTKDRNVKITDPLVPPAMQGSRVRYDWDTIAAEYIQGYFVTDPETGVRKHLYPDFEYLHKKYGPSLDRLYRKSSEDKWSLKRQVFKSKIKEHLTDRQISTFLSESAQHDALTLDKVRKLHRLLDYSLRKYSDILDAEYNMEYDPDLEVSLKDLETLTKILTSAHNLVRSVVGEPINADKSANLSAELNMLNPALEKMDVKARKNKIVELQERLKANHEKKKQINNNEDDDDDDSTDS